MIKLENGKLEMKGNAPELCVDTEDILRGLRTIMTKQRGEDKAYEMIEKIVKNSLKDEDEEDDLEELLAHLDDLLDKIAVELKENREAECEKDCEC
jgi:division protein CdvB (Snf7/Vps24/ESCRT-III family)